MDCRTFHRKLEDYLEGGLDFAARFGMERHADQCLMCEKDLAEALHLRQLIRDLRRVGAPHDFETSLLAKIRTEKSSSLLWRLQGFWLYGLEGWSWRVAGATALVTMLIVGSVSYVYLRSGSEGPAILRAAMNRVAAPASGTHTNAAVPAGTLPGAAGSPERSPALDAANRGRDIWATSAVPADSEYMEFLVPISGDRQLILRLPKTIRMRNDQPSGEYFIRNISY